MELLKRLRPTPSMAVAIAALVVALAAGASALPGRNSVDSGDIKTNAVKRSDQAQSQRTLWALIKFSGPDAQIVSQSGGVSIFSNTDSSAILNFGRNLSGRPIIASGTYLQNFATAALCGGGDEGVGCGSGPGNPPENNRRHVAVIGEGQGASIYVAVLPK